FVIICVSMSSIFFFQAEDGIRDRNVTGVQTCALPIWMRLQERVNDALMFGNIPYYDFNKSAEVPAGFFSVEIENVMPMPADDIAKQSKRHTVYFDVDILRIKSGG